ncbi:MAG: hypothetical protein ACR2NR_23790 [Solirubrobacteraceae bacterium]
MAESADRGDVAWLLIIWIALIWLWGIGERWTAVGAVKRLARRVHGVARAEAAHPFDWANS